MTDASERPDLVRVNPDNFIRAETDMYFNHAVDGFWSITVYDANGYFAPNPRNTYSLNDITATRSLDGTVITQFGGQPTDAANCLPITLGWNYMVRVYRPRQAILDGQWLLPRAERTP
ncbi:DUF1214 domain-containing protein [Mycobacterium yunnanensis]|nr:DUF1214 domain-containing protein [Mycobacterium yunnanensis]